MKIPYTTEGLLLLERAVREAIQNTCGVDPTTLDIEITPVVPLAEDVIGRVVRLIVCLRPNARAKEGLVPVAADDIVVALLDDEGDPTLH